MKKKRVRYEEKKRLIYQGRESTYNVQQTPLFYHFRERSSRSRTETEKIRFSHFFVYTEMFLSVYTLHAGQHDMYTVR